MSDILVIGGGFAGVWGAMAAARVREEHQANLTISVVAPGDDLVIRPRLYEANPGSMRVPLDRVLGPIGVGRVAAKAVALDPSGRAATVVDRTGSTRTLTYRRLVLATGSAVKRPDLPGAEHIHDVDSVEGAVALDTRLRDLAARPDTEGRFTTVVVGAGFTGLEVATELTDRLRTLAGPRANEVRVILVEHAATVGPELGPGPRPAILAALDELAIEVRLNTSLAEAGLSGVRLTDGTDVPAATVVWTAGMAASPLARQVPGQHDRLGRLLVDPHLRVPEAPDVFAAGDTGSADTGTGRRTLQCCQHAIPLGRVAGHNAAADLLGLPALPFRPEPYVTCLDLGPAGAVFTTGFDRTVRMTGQQAKDRKRLINERRIYPPVDDPTAILSAGDPARTWADAA